MQLIDLDTAIEIVEGMAEELAAFAIQGKDHGKLIMWRSDILVIPSELWHRSMKTPCAITK